MKPGLTKKYLDDLTYEILGAAIEVHKCLGPRLLESIYHKCMKHELTLRGIEFKSEMPVPIIFKDFFSITDLRCDLFVDDCILTELKAMDVIPPVHAVKALSYMKFLNSPKGIMINFNVINIAKEGKKTFVNELYRSLPDD
ncbi:MAG: GxxExxY protein [Saprospiraceae bacterium]|nr:GxxExxY protein [Saprospiraceae bacterium]